MCVWGGGVGLSLYGNQSIPFQLQLYWDVQYLSNMWSFTGKLLNSMKIPFETKALKKPQVITCPERPKVSIFHVFCFALFFEYWIGSWQSWSRTSQVAVVPPARVNVLLILKESPCLHVTLTTLPLQYWQQFLLVLYEYLNENSPWKPKRLHLWWMWHW